jgi:hypothetical protein
MFSLIDEWSTFNLELAQQVAIAAAELRQIYFADNIWNTASDPTEANQSVRRYGALNLEAHFFLKAINQSEKAASAVTDWIQAIGSISDYEVSRIALQRIANEQFLRERNLLETLLALIRFSDFPAPQNAYIEHYAAYREYEHMHKKRQEFLSAFDSAGLSVPSPFETKLDEICRQIDQIETSPGFQFANCWYLNPTLRQIIFSSVVPGTTYPAPSVLFPSTRAVIDSALQRPDQSALVHLEKGLLGLTYQGSFGVSSQDVHFSSSTSSNYILDSFRFERSVTHINLLAAVVLCRCLLMTVAPNTGPAHALFDRIVGPPDQPIYNAVVQPQAVVNDLLTAEDINGCLLCGVIVAVRPNAAGFVLYEVSVIATNPIPNQLVPATDVLHYFPRTHTTLILDQLFLELFGDARRTATDDISFAAATRENYNDLMRVAKQLGGLRHGSLMLPFYVQDPDP